MWSPWWPRPRAPPWSGCSPRPSGSRRDRVRPGRNQAPDGPDPGAVRPDVQRHPAGNSGVATAPPPARAAPQHPARLLPVPQVPPGARRGDRPAAGDGDQQRDLLLSRDPPVRPARQPRDSRAPRGPASPPAAYPLRRVLLGRGAVLPFDRAAQRRPVAGGRVVGDRCLRPQSRADRPGAGGSLSRELAPGVRRRDPPPLLQPGAGGVPPAGQVSQGGALLPRQPARAQRVAGVGHLRRDPLPQPAHLLQRRRLRQPDRAVRPLPGAGWLPVPGTFRVPARPQDGVRPRDGRRRRGLPEAGGRVIRVFLVDDSAFVRRALTRVLAVEPGFRVVGEAASGAEALARIPALEPDLVTLDVAMPGMDGLQLLPALLRWKPSLKVLMLSAHTSKGAEATMAALAAGAVDFIDKTTFNVMDLEFLRREVMDRLKALAPLPAPGAAGAGDMRDPAPAELDLAGCEVCVIGASTGGPAAVQRILQSLPARFPLPIVVVQHMPI